MSNPPVLTMPGADVFVFVLEKAAWLPRVSSAGPAVSWDPATQRPGLGKNQGLPMVVEVRAHVHWHTLVTIFRCESRGCYNPGRRKRVQKRSDSLGECGVFLGL